MKLRSKTVETTIVVFFFSETKKYLSLSFSFVRGVGELGMFKVTIFSTSKNGD